MNACDIVHSLNVSHVTPGYAYILQHLTPCFLSFSRILKRSFVCIQFGPHLLDLRPLLFRRFSVLGRAVKSLRTQAHVDCVLCFGAVSGDLPEETAGVAFVESGDDVCAI
jgi:hypothetical protein